MALGVTTATLMRKLGRSGMAVVRGELQDTEQGLDICDIEFRPQGPSVPTGGERRSKADPAKDHYRQPTDTEWIKWRTGHEGPGVLR